VSCHFVEVLAWRSQVSLQNVVVAASRAYDGLVPSNGAHSTLMTSQVSYNFIVLGIPDLSEA